mgnify:CR=1 FL=1
MKILLFFPQEQETKESSYEIKYNGKFHTFKTTAKTIPKLKNAIRTKLKLEGNTIFDLEFVRNGKIYALDDMEDLEEGMTIKVSTQSQFNLNFSSSHSNFTNGNNGCWWNTKPNGQTRWEEKGYKETKYIRYLLRDNKQNVVGNGNEYLKKLEILITFFGEDMKQINKAYVLFNEKLFVSFQYHRSYLFNQQRKNPGMFKKDDWKNGNNLGQKLKFHDHYSKMAEGFDWNHSKFVPILFLF